MVWLHVKWFCTRCIQRCQTHHLVMLIASALLLATPAMASSIGISPGEIIIEAGARWGKAKVFNNGNEAVTLRLSLVDMMMTSSGALEPVKAGAPDAPSPDTTNPEADYFAANKLRVTPSHLEIPLGKSHDIKFLVRPEGQIVNGSFHTHLNVTIIPTFDQYSLSVPDTPAGGGLSVGALPVFNFAYPVWLHRGPIDPVTITLSDPKLIQPKDPTSKINAVSVLVTRQGTGRFASELSLYFKPDGDMKEVKIGNIKRFTIYPEICALGQHISFSPGMLEEASLTSDDVISSPGSIRVQLEQTSRKTPPNVVSLIWRN